MLTEAALLTFDDTISERLSAKPKCADQVPGCFAKRGFNREKRK
jgi:hypothetical protein